MSAKSNYKADDWTAMFGDLDDNSTAPGPAIVNLSNAVIGGKRCPILLLSRPNIMYLGHGKWTWTASPSTGPRQIPMRIAGKRSYERRMSGSRRRIEVITGVERLHR